MYSNTECFAFQVCNLTRPSQSGTSNHCLSRFLWSSTAMQLMFKNCLGCIVWNYSCQKPKVCLYMIRTQIGLHLANSPFSCHFLCMVMVDECILALPSILHLIWNWLKWQHKFWNNSNFIQLVLPTACTPCLCQFSVHFWHFLEKLIKKVGSCKTIRWILTWWGDDLVSF